MVSMVYFRILLRPAGLPPFQIKPPLGFTNRRRNFSEREIPEEELSFGDYLAEGTFHLKAVFAKSEKYRLIEEYGIDSYSVCQDGRLLFERDFASYKNMREWVFSFGDKVSVLAPDKLQEDRKKQAENIIKRYGEKADDFNGSAL